MWEGIGAIIECKLQLCSLQKRVADHYYIRVSFPLITTTRNCDIMNGIEQVTSLKKRENHRKIDCTSKIIQLFSNEQ